MKCKRLADRRFCALKYNIVLEGFIFSSNGFFICYSITILIINKVLLYVMFEGFKAVVSYRCSRCDKITVLVGVVVLL